MTRDQVIEYAKDWHFLTTHINYNPDIPHQDPEIQEARDLHRACVDLAYLRTKEALAAYSKEREEKFAAHDRMLETIEQTLKGELSNDR